LRISLDDLRLMLSGRSFDLGVEPAVAIAADALRDSLAQYAAKQHLDLVIDATNVTRARRAPFLATAQQFGFTPVAIYFPCALPMAQQQNASRPNPVPANVVEAFSRRLEPPTREEGFAEVIEVSDGS
jgi:predicted kinase